MIARLWECNGGLALWCSPTGFVLELQSSVLLTGAAKHSIFNFAGTASICALCSCLLGGLLTLAQVTPSRQTSYP